MRRSGERRVEGGVEKRGVGEVWISEGGRRSEKGEWEKEGGKEGRRRSGEERG